MTPQSKDKPEATLSQSIFALGVQLNAAQAAQVREVKEG